ncbi:glycoside hydrolase family 27 protein [Sphingomonas morindae]|uniref:Alpha-galactosidase n=1 Tax=Sphingomonas morindae TaxID=1541170 RepID=A0ABY4X4U2_9SPHN|nr:glycoside hydrolase family 27 protein [Sphingomonas morindae]USI71917.1 glycoside hydrolase family 27 protein [Sphingomonas morindae]
MTRSVFLKQMARILAMAGLGMTALPVQAIDPMSPPEARASAPTPPMGWNSWNKFACSVSEQTIRAAADALVRTGMRDAGYRYVVIDDCWQGPRDENGVITADARSFPSGIKALADYVHGRGLKFGIYSDAGALTCAGRPGSQGHEFQDAQTYARWGVDYLKYDWCSTGTRNGEEAYQLMARALRASGRPILFSMCEWGTNKPWLWTPFAGQMWRTTGDISDVWEAHDKGRLGVINIADRNEGLWRYAGPGHWNDPDMLEVGNGGLSDDEARAHMALWAIMAAPLIAGNDLDAMTPAVHAILTNKAVIAVDQDALGVQGHRIAQDGDLEIWAKPLTGGRQAVLLLNRGAAPATMTLHWDVLGWEPGRRAAVRDLWADRALPGASRGVTLSVPAHGAQMLAISPA